MSSNKIEALLRGLGQGASLGWNDEASPAIAGKLTDWFGAGDQTGIPREYAAGSADADMRNTQRAENQESQDKFPGTYRAGQIAGGIPSSIAMSGMGAGAPTLAARIASGGLAAGARGGIEGAGLAEDGHKLEGAARAAGPSAVLGMAGAAAPAAVNAVKNLFKGGPPSGPLPALATAAARAEPSAAEVARGAQAARGAGTSVGPVINRALGGTAPPTPPNRGLPPQNTVAPPRRGPSMVDREAAGGRAVGAEDAVKHRDAIVPPSSLAAELAGSGEIPPPRIPTELTSDMPAISRVGKSQGDFFRQQRDAINKLMGRPDNWKPPNSNELVAQRGQSMIDALDAENSPEQLAGLPKMDSEYAEAAANAGPRRAAVSAARGKTTPLPMQGAKTPIGSPDEFKFEDSASPSGEFELSSKRPASGAKKNTDVKKLMKKRPDDSDD